jgi:alkanesulfonate monooxygenase
VPYLGQIARSAEQLRFDAALTPTGAWCEDSWVATAMLAGLSERLKFLVAFRPGMVPPFLAAQMAGSTFVYITHDQDEAFGMADLSIQLRDR